MLTTGESKSSVYRCFILVCFNFSADVKFFKWKLGIKNGKKKKSFTEENAIHFFKNFTIRVYNYTLILLIYTL